MLSDGSEGPQESQEPPLHKQQLTGSQGRGKSRPNNVRTGAAGQPDQNALRTD